MLFSFLRPKAKEEPQCPPPESIIDINELSFDYQQMLGIFSKFSLEEITNLMTKLAGFSEQNLQTMQRDEFSKDITVQLYNVLTEQQRQHVFPLLPARVRDAIFYSVPQELKLEIMNQMDGFTKVSKQIEEDPNCAASFFQQLSMQNALKYTTQDKFVYVTQASKIRHVKLVPFKYQRRLMERHVQCIAQGIQMSKVMFHPIVLAFVPELQSLTILDGQHRWHALQQVPEEIAAQVLVQFDVIVFENDDSQIMKYYKYINTNVPIDSNRLNEELRYVAVVDQLKKQFGNGIRSFSKELKGDQLPQNCVVDTYLKEELQYREILTKMTEAQLIAKLVYINENLKQDQKLVFNLSNIDARICKRDNMYLGINWPYSIHLLDTLKFSDENI
jgi:hypothetical protein